MSKIGVPCAPINSLREALDHPQTAARGMVMQYDHPALGSIKTIAQPILFNNEPRNVGSPPPMLGQHTREVLRELAYADPDIDRLAGAGVILDGAI
jgi:formyl-CoA transferase